MGTPFKDFGSSAGGDAAGSALGALTTGLSKAVRPGTEKGNPGGDGKSVDVTIASGEGSATVQAGVKFATVAGWSAIPSGTAGCSYTIANQTITVKTADGAFEGTISFWTHG